MENTNGQDYGEFDIVDLIHSFHNPMISYEITFKIGPYKSATTARQQKTNPVLSTITSKNATSNFDIPFFKGKQEKYNCQKIPPDEKKNTRMNKNINSRKLLGNKVAKVSWGHWVINDDNRSGQQGYSRTGEKGRTPRKFCCTRGRKIGEMVKKRSSCRGRIAA